MASNYDVISPNQTDSKRVVFWSSVDASVFMKAIVDSIKDHGIEAEHRYIISIKDYRAALNSWDRLWLRIRMYIEYPLKLAVISIMDKRPTINIVTTNTFFAPFIALVFSKSNQRVVHLVWDLFPDVLNPEGNQPKYGWAYKVINRIVQYIVSNVDANVFLGQKLLSYAKSRFKNIRQTHVIPVGADAEVFKGNTIEIVDQNYPIDIIYCGNLGTMHDTNTLLEVLKLNGSDALDGLKLSFYASGPMYNQFKKKISMMDNDVSNRITLASSLNNNDWVLRMKQANVALVTMRPGSENLVMPSKTYSAIAAGQAILAICPLSSDLASLVIQEDCGWVVEPGNIEGLIKVMNEISNDRLMLLNKCKNAYIAGQNIYSNKTVAIAWVNLLNDLSKK